MSTINASHLRHLAVFASVVENGSFAAAARQLGSSRSRVSEQVAQLEQILAVRLLQRSTRQLTITAEGQQVYEQARALPSILQGVESVVSASEPKGRVAITVTHDIAHKHILPLLQEFKQQYPLIQLDLILNDETVDLIHENIDLGIRVGIPKDDSLVARVLYEERFTIYASPTYLEKHGQPKRVSQLDKHQWVMLTQSAHKGALQFRHRDSLLQVKPRDYYLCNSPLMLQQMVVAGLGLGAMLETTVRDELERGELVRVLPDVSSEVLTFYLVYPSRHQVPRRTRALIDFLLQKHLFAPLQ